MKNNVIKQQLPNDLPVTSFITQITSNSQSSSLQIPPDSIKLASVSYPPLLPPQLPCKQNKKTLVLDLDETLVHSSFQHIENPSIVLPVFL